MNLLCKKCGQRHFYVSVGGEDDYFTCGCGCIDLFILDNVDFHVFDIVHLFIEKGWRIKCFFKPNLHSDPCGADLRIFFEFPVPFECFNNFPNELNKFYYKDGRVLEIFYTPKEDGNVESYTKLLDFCNELRKCIINMPPHPDKKEEQICQNHS